MAVSPKALKIKSRILFPVNVHVLPSSGFFDFSVSHKDLSMPQL